MRNNALIAALITVTLLGCDDDDPAEPDLITLNATMTGAAEVPGPGDTDGSGTAEFTINDDANEVCWEINVANLTLPAVAAHIHPGAIGATGDPVVNLTAPAANGLSSGCVAASDDLVDDIIANPGAFYVNVHTSDFQPGAIRGQLAN